jgi:hypothetical protein
MRFSDEEIRRYGRQIVLREVGGHGQERLRAATARTGSELVALYLAGAGVGRILVGEEAIAASVRALNPLVTVEIDRTIAREPDDAEVALARMKELLQ